MLLTAQQLQIRRLTPEDQPLLEGMYATFNPLSQALGLPPAEPSRRQAWLRSLSDAVNLIAFVLSDHIRL